MITPSLASWSPPTARVVIPTLIQWFQCSLLFVPPERIDSRNLSYIRAAIVPLCIYGIWSCYSHPVYSYFTPAREFMHFNLALQMGKYLAVLKSLEYGFCDEGDYAWMGYSWAYSYKPKCDGNGAVSRNGSLDDTFVEAVADPPLKPMYVGRQYGQSVRETLYLAWCFMWSFRGIGWSWGIKGKQIPARYPSKNPLPSLLFRLFWCHVVCTTLYAYLQASREISLDPSAILNSIFYLDELLKNHNVLSGYVPLLGRLVNALAFGLLMCTSIEMDVVYMAVLAYILVTVLRAIIPSSASGIASYIRPDPFKVGAWPKPSLKPLLAESITDLWSRRWHPLFKRSYVAVGARPVVRLAENMGLKHKSAKVACGALGAFIVSGFLHESINDASPWLPRDASYRSFTFFLLQILGFIFEHVFTWVTGRKVRGTLGRIWTWSFMLCTGVLLTECWLERGLVDRTPPLARWEWWRWTIPNALIIPVFRNPGIYRMYEHLQ